MPHTFLRELCRPLTEKAKERAPRVMASFAAKSTEILSAVPTPFNTTSRLLRLFDGDFMQLGILSKGTFMLDSASVNSISTLPSGTWRRSIPHLRQHLLTSPGPRPFFDGRPPGPPVQPALSPCLPAFHSTSARIARSHTV